LETATLTQFDPGDVTGGATYNGEVDLDSLATAEVANPPTYDLNPQSTTAEADDATPEDEPAEPMVPYKGQLYPESKLREVCPYLGGLGEAAYKLVVAAHIKAEAKAAEAASNQPPQKPEPAKVAKASLNKTPEDKPAKQAVESENILPIVEPTSKPRAPASTPELQPVVTDFEFMKQPEDVEHQLVATSETSDSSILVEVVPEAPAETTDPAIDPPKPRSTINLPKIRTPQLRSSAEVQAPAPDVVTTISHLVSRLRPIIPANDRAPRAQETPTSQPTHELAPAMLAPEDGKPEPHSSPREFFPPRAAIAVAHVEAAPLLVAETAAPTQPVNESTTEPEVAEPVFDAIVLETYYQLLSLSEDTTDTPGMEMALQTDLTEGTIEELSVDLDTTESSPEPANAFEAFLAAQPLPEAPPDLETIVATANEQPLETTLIQLATHLTEASAETPEAVAITTILQQIVAELPAPLAAHDLDDLAPNEPRITPELTEKLLLLVEALGYDDPSSTLVKFVAQHDLDFLLQTMGYISQITPRTPQYDKQEFLPHTLAAFAPISTGVPITNRLGRIILGLIRTSSLAPA
jgi:hypothetical protein